MDTNISHLDADASIEHSARLPDEPDLDHIEHHTSPEMDETSGASVMPKRPRRRRGRLLSGVALGVLVVAAGGILFLSPFNTFVPVPPALTAFVADATHLVTGASPQRLTQANEPGASSQAAASSPAQKPRAPSYTNPVVAPAASLAATRVPPRPDTITASRYTAQPREQNLKELLKLHSGDQDEPLDRHGDPATTQSPTSANPTREDSRAWIVRNRCTGRAHTRASRYNFVRHAGGSRSDDTAGHRFRAYASLDGDFIAIAIANRSGPHHHRFSERSGKFVGPVIATEPSRVGHA